MRDKLSAGRDALLKMLGKARALLSGRYSRDAWAAASALYLGALVLIVTPFSTFLWTIPKPVQDIYVAASIGIAASCASGFAFAYVRRLRDQNRSGLWAALLLAGIPFGLSALASAWGNHVEQQNHLTSTSDYMAIAAGASLILAIGGGLLPPRPSERFGVRYIGSDVLKPRALPVVITLLTASVVVVVAIYAAYFQDGLWVRRAQYEIDPGAPFRTGDGNVIATCGSVKGVSASAQQGTVGGFARDAMPGSWNVIVLQDGTLDILTFGPNGNLSFRADGFTVEARGLRLDRFRQIAEDNDTFQIIATGQDAAGDLHVVTVISFAKLDYRYQALITNSRTMSSKSMFGQLGEGHARVSSSLMMADCLRW